MRIAVGSDHRGRGLKALVTKLVTEAGHDCRNVGCHGDTPVDYPDIARKAARAVAAGDCERGVLVCGTGIGMSIAANKLHGIRAALCHNVFGARRAREHNDANILCLGEEEQPENLAEMLNVFLTTRFKGGRHQRRVDKIEATDC